MNIWKNHKGMSLVEIIIVIAVVGILASVSVAMIGHIRYANTKKAVEVVDKQLDRQRVEAMSKEDIPYVYIYQLGDGYYIQQLNEKILTFDNTKFTSDGTKISGKNVEIFMESTSGTKVEGTAFVRIAYRKSGVFDTTDESGEKRTNVEKIVVKGSDTYTISLVEETGKHFVKKG